MNDDDKGQTTPFAGELDGEDGPILPIVDDADFDGDLLDPDTDTFEDGDSEDLSLDQDPADWN